MPVYFVYRCHYGAPSEKHVRRFEYDTVLDWAKAVWRQFDTDEAAYKYAEELLGGLRVYGFGSLFFADPECTPSVRPKTMAQVYDWFEGMYDPTAANGPHHIQIVTDDDELDMAVFVFDDHYRKKHPGKADFLLLDSWELPAGESDGPAPDFKKIRTDLGKPAGDGEGTLYAASLCPGADNLRDKNECDRAMRIKGVRVPDLARYLLSNPENDTHDYSLREVRENLLTLLKRPRGEDKGFLVAIRDEPTEQTHWGAYSDWLQDRDLPTAGLHLLDLALRAKSYSSGGQTRKPKLDRVKVTPHLAQACKHEHRSRFKAKATERDSYGQFIFFDDRWAAAHPTLAAGILTFASRWDVLT